MRQHRLAEEEKRNSGRVLKHFIHCVAVCMAISLGMEATVGL